MGYTVIKGSRNGVEAEATFFVPLDCNAEVHKVVVRNTGAEKKELKLFSFVEWCLWNAQDDSTNFQRNFSTGEVEIKGSVIYHKTEYKERLGLNAVPAAFDYGVAHAVTALVGIQLSFCGRIARGPEIAAVIQIKISAAPHIQRYIIITKTCDAAQLCIPVKAVAARRIGNQ